MADEVERRTLSESAARQLANATKTRAQWGGITPRWLVNFLTWTPVEAGIYRLNKVKEAGDGRRRRRVQPAARQQPRPAGDLRRLRRQAARVFLKRGDHRARRADPRLRPLQPARSTRSRSSSACSIEKVKERQEDELINNAEYGLLASVAPSQRINTRKGPPTPDDLDELITKVWKEPSFFLAHPRAIAAFGRECTRRGVPPPTVTLFGSPFLTWRGLPLVPSDKLRIEGNGSKTSILLMRTGEKKQGVVGLFQPGVPGEVAPSLSVRFMGINRKAIASYLISLYCSPRCSTDDALGVLEGVEVGRYPEYTHDYA